MPAGTVTVLPATTAGSSMSVWMSDDVNCALTLKKLKISVKKIKSFFIIIKLIFLFSI